MPRSVQVAPRPRSLTVLLAAALLASLLVALVPSAATASPPEDPQSPFLCLTEFSGLGQPIVDNQDGRGTPVYPLLENGQPDRNATPLGWSEQCQAEERVTYHYRTNTGALRELPAEPTDLPADVMMLPVDELVGAEDMELGDATAIPYVLRYERGTLPENRFMWSIAMLVPWDEVIGETEASHDHWNGRLVFSFDGGVAIGHSQGTLSTNSGTHNEAMQLGHAILYSSGTATSVHYNLLRGGRTAEETKATFEDRHGAPRYTVGIGGSGGGIQQYIYGQNNVGVLDAAVPQYSYPDMSTQTIHTGDCELLEYYMDETDGDNPRWDSWDNRKILQGQNSIEGFTSTWQNRMGATGSSECIEGWRGLTPLAMNPRFGFANGLDRVLPLYLLQIVQKLNQGLPPVPDSFPDIARYLRVSEDPAEWVEWTHWDDVREVYGTDPETGYARVPWDNVGVQYGLRALTTGQITPEEFLDVNHEIGSWKDPEDAELESCGTVGVLVGAELAGLGQMVGLCDGEEIDRHSARQMRHSEAGAPAPRRTGDVDAIRGAFEHDLVFQGEMPRMIPIIDARHYLEHRLDMHNVHQSWAARERITRAQGHHDNHLIWFLDARPSIDGAATTALLKDGFRATDEWMLNIEEHPTNDVVASKPDVAVDKCWDTDGTLVAEGDDAWDGAEELIANGEGAWTDQAPTSVDGQPTGGCTQHFPLHSTSRIVAGAPITGDVYKCHTMPVGTALEEGLYGDWAPTGAQLDQLEAIFPEGVCDYGVAGVGDPRTDVPAAVTANPGELLVEVTGAEPGATIELRQGGEVVATQAASAAGAAAIPAEPGTYVATQRVDGQRGLLSMPVAVAVVTDPPPGPGPGLPFSDIDGSFVHTPAIVRLAELGILLGRPDGTFRPFEDLTRGQMSSIVARALELEPVPTGPFSDVDPSGVHAGSINALAAAGIVEGRPDGTFDLDAGVTRGQLSTMLARAAGLQGIAGSRFPDTAGSVHEPAINALAAADVIGGYADGTFRPGVVVNRAQAATFVSGFLDVIQAD